MNKLMINLINHLSKKQNTLFLIDSLGAFLTALFLFIIMQQLNQYFGMPKTVLTNLSVIAGLFCIYSTACFLFLKGRWTLYIRIIGVANLLYCVLTIGLLIKYYSLLTIIGTIYFLIEIVIICGLSYVELKVAAEIKKKSLVEN